MSGTPGPFKGTCDQIIEAITNGELSMDFAVQFTHVFIKGAWGQLHKLLEIAGL